MLYGIDAARRNHTGERQAPLPQLLAGAGLVLSVPWWAHRRRRAKVRVERALAVWPDVAAAVGLAGSRVQSAMVSSGKRNGSR